MSILNFVHCEINACDSDNKQSLIFSYLKRIQLNVMLDRTLCVCTMVDHDEQLTYINTIMSCCTGHSLGHSFCHWSLGHSLSDREVSSLLDVM